MKLWHLVAWRRPRRVTPFGLYIGLRIALNYRPGHPWAGIAGGATTLVVLAVVLMLLLRLLAFRLGR